MISILFYEVFEVVRIAGRCHEAIACREHSLRDVTAQATGTAGYQPDFRHEKSPITYLRIESSIISVFPMFSVLSLPHLANHAIVRHKTNWNRRFCTTTSEASKAGAGEMRCA